ncbi:MAG: hypothetical protein OER88_13305, partial [Planctomycetota bacterium]|nr:hypothetical protein [Planctomycetota bacterium]
LVVVSILGVLMGLVSILVIRASSHQERNMTETLIKTFLPNSIERYKTEMKRLPPQSVTELQKSSSRWKSLALSDANATNDTAECLLVALRHPDFSAPLGEGDLPTENPFGNRDEDAWNSIPDGSDNDSALEILDAYGNAIVYINKNHYGETYTITNLRGEEVEVTALKKPDGTYYNKSSYQLISVGENGVQDDDPETSDDIVNFTMDSGE